MEGLRTALLSILVLAYTCTIVKQQPVGWQRFAYTLPTLLWCCSVPHQITGLVTIRGGLAFILTWLTNAKLLAFTANRGPLSHPGLSSLQFLSLLLLPVYSAKTGYSNEPTSSSKLWVSAASLAIKAVLFGAMTLLLSGPVILPSIVTHVCYAAYIYLVVSLQLDPFLPFVQSLLTGQQKDAGMTTAQTSTVAVPPLRLQNSMDAPFLSSSIKDFWGRRYNQVVSATLTDCVYAPIIEGSWIKRVDSNGSTDPARFKVQADTGPQSDPPQQDGVRKTEQHSNGQQLTSAATCETAIPSLGTKASSARRWLAVASAFLASGLMHEVMIWYMCGQKTFTWGLMTTFFAVQPVLMGLESLLAAVVASQPIGLKKQATTLQRTTGFFVRVFRTVVTLAVLAMVAEPLFWKPFAECRIDSTGLAEARSMVVTFQQLLSRQ